MEDLTGSLGRMIEAEEAEPSGPRSRRPARPRSKDRPAKKARKRDQAIDLMVLVHPLELDKAQVRSLLAEAIAGRGRDAALARSAQGARGTAPRRWRPCGRQHPEDLSVGDRRGPAGAGHRRREADRAGAGPAGRAGGQDPAGGPARGARANSRQRAQATRQLPLWVVARACWKRSDSARLRGIADKLAARAIEAARRQSDNHALMAMLRERGDLALARGDRSAAEAEWVRMLETVIEPPGRKARKEKPAPAAATPSKASATAPRRRRWPRRQPDSIAPLRRGGQGGLRREPSRCEG